MRPATSHPFRVGLKGKQTLPFGDCSDGERLSPSPPPLPLVENKQWYACKCLTTHWRHLWSVNTPARVLQTTNMMSKWPTKCFAEEFTNQYNVSWVELAHIHLEGSFREPQCLMLLSLAL